MCQIHDGFTLKSIFPTKLATVLVLFSFGFSLKCNWCSVRIWKINSTKVFFSRWNDGTVWKIAKQPNPSNSWIESMCAFTFFNAYQKAGESKRWSVAGKSVWVRKGKRLYELLVRRISLNWLACNGSTTTRCLSSTLALYSPKIHFILPYLANQNEEFSCIWNNLTMFASEQLQF